MGFNILYVAAEAEPYVKVGGLGDVAGALPKAIRECGMSLHGQNGVDIRLVLPYHHAIKKKNFSTKYLGEFPIPKTDQAITCQVYQAVNNGLKVYFLDGEPIDKKSPVYSLDPIHDGQKFTFFSLASLHLPDFLDWPVDILHGNDWHTAVAIYALRTHQIRSRKISKAKTVHTLHNLPFMGTDIGQVLSEYGIQPVEDEQLPAWARKLPLPLGLLHADKIVAVSPNYAKEIFTPQFGCGLDTFLNTRKHVITGIINGLDYKQWDPATDPEISQNFSIENLEDRSKNKRVLQKDFNLKVNKDTPLLTIISRMDAQKGFDIAIKGLGYLQNESWQAVFLGTGDPIIEGMTRGLEAKFPDRVRSLIKFDSTLARQLYASTDIFMMPSRYEPCGLSQMIAMRYGCVPIARATGGLVNTIKHVSKSVSSGTGFLFHQPYPSAFSRILSRALHLYLKPQQWRQIQINGMKMDFSWETSAQKYIDVYQELLSSET